MSPLKPLPDCLDLIQQNIKQLGSISVPVIKSKGRILDEDVVAKEPIPAHPTSIMDGFSVSYDSLHKFLHFMDVEVPEMNKDKTLI